MKQMENNILERKLFLNLFIFVNNYIYHSYLVLENH